MSNLMSHASLEQSKQPEVILCLMIKPSMEINHRYKLDLIERIDLEDSNPF